MTGRIEEADLQILKTFRPKVLVFFSLICTFAVENKFRRGVFVPPK